MSLGGGAALVGSDLLGAKAGDPHVPAPFQHQLHVLHFDGGGFPKEMRIIFVKPPFQNRF